MRLFDAEIRLFDNEIRMYDAEELLFDTNERLKCYLIKQLCITLSCLSNVQNTVSRGVHYKMIKVCYKYDTYSDDG